MITACLRCGSPLSSEMKACPGCGLNLQTFQKFTNNALLSGSLYVKTQDFIQEYEAQSISEDEFISRLNQELELTQAMLDKYSQNSLPELAPICSCLIQALSFYQEALTALGEAKDSAQALKLAEQADTHLAELDTLQKELKASQAKIQG